MSQIVPLHQLADLLEGDLFYDELHKIIYSTDASTYQIKPIAVARPKSVADIQAIVRFANEHQIPLTPRTAGTSLAGQTVGSGIIVDVSKYFTQIVSFDKDNKTVTVQPGVIRDELNLFLKPHGLFFGPNTSTSNRCMIGGMVGNNSSGTTSIRYGVTRDKVVELKAILSDGSAAVFKSLSSAEFIEKTKGESLESKIYNTLYEELSNAETQKEIVNEFPKPEIQAMARVFADFESIQAEAYARLNEELGLDDFQAFLEDETSKAKIERLIETPGETLEERALSLAIFSAFTEGVNLFSSFAILMSFQLRNLMKGTGQIVEWSVRDESLHSKAGCWLFRTLLEEQPELNNNRLRDAVIEACQISVQLEFDFIDKAFEMGAVDGLNVDQLKNFIKARANEKIIELGYKAIYNDIDPNLLKQIEWFGHLTSGKTHQDFFAGRVTSYSKSTADWDDL